ncbi:MAG: DNA pilot protein [Microvirus sp.]|nr:MAG: DNA pilot protein [Microvirus sp.]
MAWVAPVISGASSIIGGLIGSSGQSSANAANIALQRQQQDWEERMSNTSYQRQVKDLKAAGLNPMLGYMQGHGASTPDVAPARVENAKRQAGEGISSAGGAAMDAYMKRAQKTAIDVANVKVAKEAELAGASTAKTMSEKSLIDAQAAVVSREALSRIGLNVSSAGRAEAETTKLGVDVEALKVSIAKVAAETRGVRLSNELIERTMDALVSMKSSEASQQSAKALPAKAVNVGAGYLTSIGDALGGSLADARDWLHKVWSDMKAKNERARR